MQTKRGYFITIEGVEGVGKTTNIETIKSFLDERGIQYQLTREPGGTVIAEKVRDLLLADHGENFSSEAELLLIFAARAQHIAELIEPALAAGKWVICDRFTDATFAYQGGGRGLDRTHIETLQLLVQGQLRPDLTILFDLDPAIGMERVAGRGEKDRFEAEQLEFFRRVRQTYLDIAAAEPDRCAVIDAAAELSEVQVQLRQLLALRLQPVLS
ncbi:MAG: dTMP kinase [Gammaproteobacteria bacterium]